MCTIRVCERIIKNLLFLTKIRISYFYFQFPNFFFSKGDDSNSLINDDRFILECEIYFQHMLQNIIYICSCLNIRLGEIRKNIVCVWFIVI